MPENSIGNKSFVNTHLQSSSQSDIFNYIIDATEDVIFIQDINGMYVYIKSAINDLFSEDNLLHKYPKDIFTENNLLSLNNCLQDVLKTGKSCYLEIELISNEKPIWFLFMISPILDEGGIINATLTIARNITFQKTSEQALIESEDRLRVLIEAMPDIVCFKDGKGRWLEANKADLKLFGIENVDFKGKKDSDLASFSPFYKDAFLGCEDSDEKAWIHGKALKCEEIIPRKDGTDLIYDIVKIPLFNSDGGRKGLLVIGHDITESKRYETELRQANAAKDRFFSIIAHDLKNPFQAISGFTDLLNSEYDDFTDEEKRMFIQNIKIASDSAYKLLQNLLEWSRAQTGRIPFIPDFVDLSILANETIQLLKTQADSKNIKIHSSIMFNTKVYADENMVKTILRNLISNAIKFTNKNGIVNVFANIDKNKIFIHIKDNGVGISKEDIDKLFRIENIYKTNGTENEEGTGLGLVICKEMVMKNGGIIFVESGIEKGSEFIFSLPLKKIF